MSRQFLATRSLRSALVIFSLLVCGHAFSQVCVAPGKDGPATPSGVVNTYYLGVATGLTAGATSLSLGLPSTGAAGTVTLGDMLLIVQMQGADINLSDDERYGDGSGTAGNTPTTTISQATGYTALNLAGGFEYVQVTGATGANITFTPALTNSYAQNITTQPRRTYQIIRVPQYSSATINSAAPVTAQTWDGAVGGVVAMDVAGAVTFAGSGPHIDTSNRGFRGGAQGVANSACCNNVLPRYVSTITADGGAKGEGVAGTPRYLNQSIVGTYNSGTRFSDPAPNPVILDQTATNMGYPGGDYMRGSPANAGGGGNTHNSAGGGGGNGGAGGNGGQTYNGDSLRDLGGYGGSQMPQSGGLIPTRIFMGGAGGSGSLNNDNGQGGSGGNGGGIIMLRAGSLLGAGVLRSDGQRAWDSNVSNDAGGGGGAGGSVLVIAGTGHGNVTVQARGGDGADSNVTTGSTASAPPAGNQGACCGGEREGPGGGGGGGAVLSNATLGSLVLSGGINGLSREDKAAGFSGNMRASPGSVGTSNATIAAASIVGAREGYACKPVLTVTKLTTTPALNVPPATNGSYKILVRNAATGGWAYGIAAVDTLPSPFTLPAPGTGNLAYAGLASYGATQPASTPAFALSPATWGQAGLAPSAFNLAPGAAVTLTFNINLNGATAGTYQNPAVVNYTDPTRTAGGSSTGGTVNPTVTPGGTDASGATVAGSNYVASSSTQDDIVISGTPGTSADLAIVKTGSTNVFTGDAVSYNLVVSNSGPSNVTGSITIADNVPASIGTVTWVCTITGGAGDCDTAVAGPGAAGSGNTILLNRVSLNSGAQLTIVITGTAASSGVVTNTATVSLPAGFTDPTPSNNGSTATTTITTPTADLSVSKSNGTTTVPRGGVTNYSITVGNNGPAPASNATVFDPAAAGIVKLSMTCTAFGGASCPGSFSTTTFEATGLVIPTLPVGGTVLFVVSSQITGTPSVSNSASVTSALPDPVPGNNNSTDTDTVVVNPTRVLSSANICAAGTTEQLTNLLTNSDFANVAALVGTTQTQYAAGTAAVATGVAVQSGSASYNAGAIVQNPFPGDVGRSVSNANSWVWSKGNNTGAAWRLWRQSVSGLVANRSYQFMYYYSSPVAVGQTTTVQAQPQLQIFASPTTYVQPAITVPFDVITDTWALAQSTFIATTTAVTLELWDIATTTPGDDAAFTQLILRECRPNADPAVTKTNGTGTLPVFSTTNYTITVTNNNPAAVGSADNITVRDAAATGLTKNSISCSASGGAVCPPSVTLAGIESAGGLTIPSMPYNGTVVFSIVATATLLSGSVTNTVVLGLPPGLVDTNLVNNTALDVDAIKGAANLTITKTNNTTTVAAGGTTAYIITANNGGPSSADGATLTDPAVVGLSCTDFTCTSATGMTCPTLAGTAAARVSAIQSGLVLNPFPAGGSLTFRLACSVTATGQ